MLNVSLTNAVRQRCRYLALCIVIIVAVMPLGARAAETEHGMLADALALAARKDFAGAARIAAIAVEQFPASREARLMLARIQMWDGRYVEAASGFTTLLTQSPRDGDARLGLAQAKYWSGDYRAALRHFREVPERSEAQQAIREIKASSSPGYSIGAGMLSDDQPYRATTGLASVFIFSDPLTKWWVDLDGSRLTASKRTGTSSIRAGLETSFPALRTTVRMSLARMRFPDESSKVLPSLSLLLRFTGNTVVVSASREPLLRTASSLTTHASVNVVAIGLSRGERFAMNAREFHYFDGNRGRAVDGFALVPLKSFALGTSAAWRDTDESRFGTASYDPYYTPLAQREVRAIGSWKARRGQSDLGLHLDGGIAHDDIAGSYRPWRAALTFSRPIARGATLAIAAERNSTAFYTSNEIRASVAGRF